MKVSLRPLPRPLDHQSRVHLNTLFIAFNHLVVDGHVVAGNKLGNLGLELIRHHQIHRVSLCLTSSLAAIYIVYIILIQQIGTTLPRAFQGPLRAANASTLAWCPEISTSGTVMPRYAAGRV